MAQKAPGKHYRIGMSLFDAVKEFSDEEAVEKMFVEARWPQGVRCVRCDSQDIQPRPTRKPQPFRCRSCRTDFSVKTGTVMESSKLTLGKWALAAYILTTNLKGVSSMKLRRDLGVTQKTAWFMAHRIREAWRNGHDPFSGPVEADETYVGGLEKNKHRSKRLNAGGGPMIGKTPVAGVKDRATGKVSADVVEATNKPTLDRFVRSRIEDGAEVYTDEATMYADLPNHVAVRHSVGEYVREQAHTNGMESFWATLKRGYEGVYHQMSPKHLGRYVTEFSGRHNDRPADTADQITNLVRGMDGKRLRYQDLVA